jgi:thioesterase domain-containing protein
MAAHHLKDLRAHRPKGPYLIGGFCIGALIAHEMARQLRESGEEVPLVVLIDPQLASNVLRAHLSFTDAIARRRNLDVERKTQLFIRGYKALFRLREEWNAPWREKARFAASLFKRMAGSKANGPVPQDVNSPDAPLPPLPAKDGQDILARLLWMISAYKPARYEGRVAMFLTDEQKELAPFLPRKWRAVTPGLELHRVPGRHLGAITTDVHLLAEKLRACLDGTNPAPESEAQRRG